MTANEARSIANRFIDESISEKEILEIIDEIKKCAQVGGYQLIIEHFISDEAKHYFRRKGFNVHERWVAEDPFDCETSIEW
jgi:hypothetical protein